MKIFPYIVILFLQAVSVTLCGQVPVSGSDTLHLGEVSVTARKVKGTSGFKVTSLEAEAMERHQGRSVAFLLERESSLLLKNYGNGGLASASFRGMGASKTRVYWNGIPVNSPANGQADLSLIPVHGTGRIDVFHGASPAFTGTGGPGGTLSLITGPEWLNGISVSSQQGAGSFGLLSEDISLRAGNGNYEIISSAWFRKAENNFTWVDDFSTSQPVIKERTNSSYSVSGATAGIYLKRRNTIITGMGYINWADRNLPGPVIEDSQGSEQQYDRQVRVVAGLKNYSLPVKLDFKGAYITDYLDYINEAASLESLTRTRSLYFSGDGKYDLKPGYTLNIAFSDNYAVVLSDNHGGEQGINHAILRASLSAEWQDRIALYLSAEITHARGELLIPTPSAGFDLKVTEGGALFLKGNIGRSVTLPTLNDLFWVPGGNPDLKNETGVNSELSLEVKKGAKRGLSATGEITIYYSNISNMIKWLPGDYGIWSPVNIPGVVSSGSEASGEVSIDAGRSEIKIGTRISYTNTTGRSEVSESDNSSGKQLIYVPYWQGGGIADYTLGAFTAGWYTRFTGARYTTADNTLSLDPFIINDLILTCRAGHSRNTFSFALEITNIFNTEYENIAWYPMPGRGYRVSLKYNFRKLR
ncbi:MAG: TonB-dependent receptor plug domain-containing protein [Bacteroidales bacterium]